MKNIIISLKFFFFQNKINRILRHILKSTQLVVNEEKLYEGIVFFHLSKLYSLSNCTITLIRKKFIRESDVLLRSFLETYINLRYISQKSEIRSYQYALGELEVYLNDHNFKLNHVENVDKKRITDQNTKFNKQAEKIKEHLKSIDSSTDYDKFKWNSIRIREKFKDLNIQENYLTFKYLSNSLHPSPASGDKYLKIINDITYPIFPKKYKDNMISDRLDFLVHYLLEILIFLHEDELLNINDKILNDNKLKNLTKRYIILNPIKSK